MSATWEDACALVRSGRHLRFVQKPLIGGVWGSGQFALGAMESERNGYPYTGYAVLSLPSGAPLSYADNKARALQDGRRFLEKHGPQLIHELNAAAVAYDQELVRERQEWIASAKSRNRPAPSKIPKRRREVFDKSAGKCHYCATPLEIEGKWHIEHMMPRALLGSDGRENLVAACIPCNMKKRDRTDFEFKKGAA